MNTYTVEQVAEMWHCKPGVVKAVIAKGDLQTRRDGRIGDRALAAYIRRRQRLTRIYLEHRRAGLKAKQAWRLALREVD